MRPRFFTTAPPLIAVALFVASCGATPDSDQTDAVAASPAQAADETGTDNGADSGTGSEAPIEDIAPTTDGLAAPAATDAPAGSEAPVPTEPVPTEPATTEPAAQPLVVAAALGGRTFDADLVPSSDVDTNFLPDLVVDDVGRDAKANIRNIFPADRPVLLWMWAPH